MIKGFFFDLDGTLVDTHMANYEAYHRALLDVGVDVSLEEFKKYIGHQAQVFLPKLAPGLTKEDYVAIGERKSRYYADLMHVTTLNTHLVGFMDLIKGSKLVLVTTAKRKNAEAVLAHHNLRPYFDYIITAEDVEKSKPSPDAYLLALDKTELIAAEALAFEDSDVGRQAADAAGIATVMINQFAL